MGKYYDGTKLLSMLDINGNKPEIYMCTTNRTGGKTTYFGRLCINRFLDKGEKFGLIYRYNYELDDVVDKFYKDLGSLFFTGHEMTSKRRASGIFHELFLDDKSCGYALSLNSADQIKKYSHLFSDIQRMIFDEFQSETNHYCNDESKVIDENYEMVIQVNGKVRGKESVKMNSSEEEMKNVALSNENVKKFISDKEIIKIIPIKNKLVNIVVK